LQQPSRTADSYGGTTTTWSDVATVWADIQGLAGRESMTGDEVHARGEVRIWMRYRTDVQPDWRATCDGRTYEFVSAADPDGRREMLVLSAVEDVT
jgi:SPP1 family predicted phage head-tail adaptor